MENKVMDSLIKEKEILRNELTKLKECQFHYFWSSITATGTIIGIGSAFGTKDHMLILYLAPLFVIIPCWLIFFDKATTITRIVGYYRVVEYMILDNNDDKYKYIGWENSLKLLRAKQSQDKEGFWKSLFNFAKRFWTYLKISGKGIFLLITFEMKHRYWILIWHSFFCISALCVYLGSKYVSDRTDKVITMIFCSALLLSIIHNLYILYNLCKGKSSYDAKWELWKDLLKSDEVKQFFRTVY